MAQINKPSEYFNTKLYTGTGAENSISDIGFNPDFVWFKKRSASEHHFLYDQVRGALKKIATSNTNPQFTETQTLKSFDTGGYTLGTSGEVNGSATTYVSWNWLAGGTGVSNTDGSITSTVSANTTSGFSVVTYSGNSTAGATIGHGLGVAPEIVFYKATTAAFDWLVYSKALGATKELVLNSTAAGTTSSVFNNQDPTSTNLIVNTNSGNNSSSHSYVAYCFAPKKGFSKFGSYVGNGSADGTFVYTGFKPAMIIFKNTTTSGTSWTIYDNKRDTYNVTNHLLLPSGSDPEISANSTLYLDFLSNGFKMRGANSTFNTSGDTYIYMAFAEEPLVGTNNIPATAR